MTIFTSQNEKIEFLKSTDIFKPLSEETIELLVNSCEEVALNPGEFLFHEGEHGDAMFVILVGELSIEKQNTEIAKRERGDHIGEMALVESGPRSATVRAITQSFLLKIVKDQFQEHFTTNPQLLMEVLKKITLRSREDLRALDQGMKILQDQKKLNENLQDLLNDTSNEIYTFDPQSLTFLDMNARLLKNLGFEKKGLVTLKIFDVLKDLDQENFEELVEPLRSGKEGEIVFNSAHIRKDGSHYPVEIRLKLRKDENPPVFVGIAQDISKIKAIESKYKHLAFHDTLTNLPSKKSILKNLTFALSHAREENNSLAVLLIGLDKVNLIDNSLGPQAGDLLVQAVAKRLKEGLSPKGYLGRYKGAEFIIVLSDINFETEAAEIARHILKSFQTPISINEEEIYPQLNIGISYYPLDGDEPENLIQQGETAKEFAKRKGSNTYCHYTPDMGFQIKNKLILERDLQKALENEEFELYYQPKLHLQSETIAGVEALLRWNHPERGLVPPMDFIPVAEKSNLIIPIGDWVLKTACKQLKTWLNMNLPVNHIAVNFSPKQFIHPDFVTNIAEIIVTEEIYPEHLELEITETTMMKNMEMAVSKLKQLNGIGVKISLDDFGTGYSSLGYLNRFPLSNIKIDRTFVKDILKEEDAIIAKGIVSLAKTFNLQIIAEGVETEEQKEIMRAIGCDYIQGYLLSRPLSAEDATKLFSSL